ncbi:MAG: Uma2 family endonuclease [Leptolyngbyaceae cyanobacterium RM1_406_9]|nr:Uma2 family endonuclease [Leptolyngbyaceae cyanobacterium RM1_406_9]
MHVETVQGDVHTTQRGRTWEQFKHLQKGFENTRGVRLFYYNGTIEILTSGEVHELFKSIIGFLIETFLFSRAIEFKPTGSMTQEKAGIASAETDESYEIEGFKLSIEVNFTSSDDSKLGRYQALEVNEVWIWEDGVLAVYHLQSGKHERVNHSLIPALSPIDLNILSECILIGETSRIRAAQKLLDSHPIHQ